MPWPGSSVRQPNTWAQRQTGEQQRAAAEARRLADQAPPPAVVPRANPHLARMPTITVGVSRAERAAASEAARLKAQAEGAKMALHQLEREYRETNRYERGPLLAGLVAAERTLAADLAAAIAGEIRALELQADSVSAAYAGLGDLAPPLLARQAERRAEVEAIEQDIADLEAATSWITYHVGLGATARAGLRRQVNELVSAGETAALYDGRASEYGMVDPNSDELKHVESAST